MNRHAFVAILALVAIAVAAWHLERASNGIDVIAEDLNGTPARLFRPTGRPPGPVVVIAHGFAGSSRLMDSFALSFARAGYTAVTFDFPGHGHNPRALTGSLTELGGATRTLLASLGQVTDAAERRGDGRIAVLGHSMASDIVVRFAEQRPDVAATIAVSMFAPSVTATQPRNLLVIVGEWEGPLKREALRAVGLASAPAPPVPFVTYGSFQRGDARRASFSAHVEHASVLFSEDSMRESVAWLDGTFGIERRAAPLPDGRGPWILLLIAAIVALGWPVAAWLPRVAESPLGPSLRWRRFAPVLLLPPLATPLLLRVMPTHFLPVLVGDYLAVHFATYGCLTGLCLAWMQRFEPRPPPPPSGTRELAVAAGVMVTFGFAALVVPLDRYVTSFTPTPARVPLILAMLVGTLAYFLADEWATRGGAAARGIHAATKVAFLVSLGLAVALDFQRLFFLIIIVPVIVLFFVVHGAFSSWAYRRTGHPSVGAIASAVAFAWAIGVTFPLLAG